MLTTCSTSRLAKSQQNGRTDAPLAGMRGVVSWLDLRANRSATGPLPRYTGLEDRYRLAPVLTSRNSFLSVTVE